MYTKKGLGYAANIIKKIALDNHVSESQVRMDMKEAMEYSRSNPDPNVRAKWATFEYAGDEPTIEEFILWTSLQAVQRTKQKNTAITRM